MLFHLQTYILLGISDVMSAARNAKKIKYAKQLVEKRGHEKGARTGRQERVVTFSGWIPG